MHLPYEIVDTLFCTPNSNLNFYIKFQKIKKQKKTQKNKKIENKKNIKLGEGQK